MSTAHNTHVPEIKKSENHQSETVPTNPDRERDHELLGHLLYRYFGPRQGNSWPCSHCHRRNPSVMLNEVLGDHRIKWRCAHCFQWGDEYDILRLFYPRERFPQLRDRLTDEREAWEAGQRFSFP